KRDFRRVGRPPSRTGQGSLPHDQGALALRRKRGVTRLAAEGQSLPGENTPMISDRPSGMTDFVDAGGVKRQNYLPPGQVSLAQLQAERGNARVAGAEYDERGNEVSIIKVDSGETYTDARDALRAYRGARERAAAQPRTPPSFMRNHPVYREDNLIDDLRAQ